MESRTLHKLDHKIISFMKKYGERVELLFLGSYFLWFGLLKIFGGKSASSIIAKSIYWIDPSIGVPALGLWEAVIGLGLLIHRLHRLAVFLLIVRIPGVFLALIYHYDECFLNGVLEPSIQGQYLIKQLTLIGAALVIGSLIKPKQEITKK